MTKNNFSKPPLKKDSKAREEAFLNLEDENAPPHEARVAVKKTKLKPLFLRAPESLWDDIQEITAITGLSMNAICLEILRPSIKNKLKDLKSD